MTAQARQHHGGTGFQPVSRDDWITADEAARLTGVTVRRWQQRVKFLAKLSLARMAPPASEPAK